MAQYALGNLHLSFQTDKSMDVFGKVWRNHEKRIEKNCNRMITDDDTLVLVGERCEKADLYCCLGGNKLMG